MAAKLISDEYKYYDIIYNDTAECGVDIEYYLPDYCPDIQKVLKCCVSPNIENSSAVGDRITVSGNIGITVMYCDEKAASIRSCEFSKDFTCTVKLPVSAVSAVAELTSHCGHIVCRAVNARKLDVHIPLMIDCNVFSAVSESYTKDVEGAEKLVLSESVSKSRVFTNREISINNDFELPESAPPIESVFRKDVTIKKVTYTLEDDAIAVNGEVDFTVCYRSYAEDSVLEKMKYNISFSELVPCEGIAAESDLICNVNVVPTGFSLQLREDSIGEYTRLALYLKANIIASVYKNTDITYIKDAFTTDCIGKEKYAKVNIKSYEPIELYNEITRTLPLENCERIFDIWCSDFTVAAFTEPGKLNYRGSFLVNVVYMGKDKRLSSAVKSYDFTVVSELSDAYQRRAAVTGVVEMADFRLLSENEVEFKAKLNIKSFVSVKKVFEQLTEEEYVGELPEYSCGKLVVCYDNNQSLWQLGKNHRISIDSIKSVNDICDDADCKYPLILFR